LPHSSGECVGEVYGLFAARRDFFLLPLHVGTEQHGGFHQTGAYTETSQSPGRASRKPTSNSTRSAARQQSQHECVVTPLTGVTFMIA
jgi:hypothetical protein